MSSSAIWPAFSKDLCSGRYHMSCSPQSDFCAQERNPNSDKESTPRLDLIWLQDPAAENEGNPRAEGGKRTKWSPRVMLAAFLFTFSCRDQKYLTGSCHHPEKLLAELCQAHKCPLKTDLCQASKACACHISLQAACS